MLFNVFSIAILLLLIVETRSSCPWNNNLFSIIENGQISTKYLQFLGPNLVDGYIEVSCRSGFVLHRKEENRVQCLSTGSWSTPLPTCRYIGLCPIDQLNQFLDSSKTIRVDSSKMFLKKDINNENMALGGSNLTVECLQGYIHVGGPLQIVCTKENGWTEYPACLPVTTQTTTVERKYSRRCSFDESQLHFDHAFISKSDRFYAHHDGTAEGFLLVTCDDNYSMDPISQGRYFCVDGYWSPRPYCTVINKSKLCCSLMAIQNLLHDPNNNRGLKIASQSLSVKEDDRNSILLGSYIQFECQENYMNEQNNLRVICQDNGLWSPYPKCVPSIQKDSQACFISDLTDFIEKTSDRIEIDQSKTLINKDQSMTALPGSVITLTCRDGFYQAGPSLTIICHAQTGWSAFPQCLPSSSSTVESVTSTMRSSVPCTFDEATWKFDNAYISDINDLEIISRNEARGWIRVSCLLGYSMDSSSLGLLICDQGSWSSRPLCSKSRRCSRMEIDNLLNDQQYLNRLTISSQESIKDPNDENTFLPGTKFTLECQGSIDDPSTLTVVCLEDGLWTPFPDCQAR